MILGKQWPFITNSAVEAITGEKGLEPVELFINDRMRAI